MGLTASIIVATVIVVLLFLAVIIYALLEWGGVKGTRKKVAENQYPCLQDGDCSSQWGLANHICDPKLKQCRIQSYQTRSCTTDDQCLAITPHCILPPIFGVGKMCSHLPFTQGDLFGDPAIGIGGCIGGLVRNSHWNFCQSNIGGTCSVTDDCAHGACENGLCKYLGDYAVCTEGSSYGNNQCSQANECALDTRHPLSARRCQPKGVAPGADGSFCDTNADCQNKDCYRISVIDPVGICATHVALIGMACTNSSQCIQGLVCDIHSGQTSGTCVFADPENEKTQVKNCPAGQYGTVDNNGCVQARYPVPCSSSNTCVNQCVTGNIPQLVLGFLGPDQSWNSLYGKDTQGIFTSLFQFAPDMKTIFMKPQCAMLISVSQLVIAAKQDYPTITLTPASGPAVPRAIADFKACQPLTTEPAVIESSFATTALTNVIFTVTYDPSGVTAAPSTWKVQAILVNSPISNGQLTVIDMVSKELCSDFYVNQNPYPPTTAPYSSIYLPCNYHGRTTLKPWTPPADHNIWPDVWKTPSSVSNPQFFLIPPPQLPPAVDLGPAYFASCLRFEGDNPATVEPLDVFAHFLYYPTAGETVISWKFNVLPTQVAGGLTTLVGLYEVERNSPGKARRLVVSTLTLYTSTTTDAELTAQYDYSYDNKATIWAYRVKPVYSAGVNNIYASVYSFVLIDFEHSWPFTTNLLGNPTTLSDTAGLCNVTFTDTSHGNAEVLPLGTLPPVDNLFPVFTPRSYTRIQATTRLRTQSWRSTVIFGSEAPSLLDSDMIVMGSAGRSSIIGLLLVYEQSPSPVTGQPQPPQTLLLTMRFGDTIPTSFYSIPNLATIRGAAYPTRMYTFYLTPDIEETGGGNLYDVTFARYFKYAFPTPQIALSPTSTQDISSWVTGPFIPVEQRPPEPIIDDSDGKFVLHEMRTPYGCEVFTACLIPVNLKPPIRFIRMPSATVQSAGSDDLWIWGVSDPSNGSVKFVPVFFDNLGVVDANFPTKPPGNTNWISAAATTCPPTAAQVTLGMDRIYHLTTGQPLFFPSWNINPNATITFNPAPQPPFNSKTLDLTGRMCETQGYQDGILYRARPYVYAESSSDDIASLPFGVNKILSDTTSNEVILDSLQAVALALSSVATGLGPRPQDALPLIGIGSIQVLIGGEGYPTYPVLPNLLNVASGIAWVGSECGVPMLPGGYKTLPCPSNPRALTMTTTSIYPTTCRDYGLPLSDRKPLQICVIYRTPTIYVREMRLYDIRATRGSGGTYSVNLISDTPVQTHGGIVTMDNPNSTGPIMGYPGFNGGPAVVYTACT